MKKLPKVTKHDRGYWLRVWRAERHLTRWQAAQIVGINASHWSLIETGKRNASPKVAVLLAEMTGQPLEIFLGIKVTR